MKFIAVIAFAAMLPAFVGSANAGSIDGGNSSVIPGTLYTLFNGSIPDHGFMVQCSGPVGSYMFIDDDGDAGGGLLGAGFQIPCNPQYDGAQYDAGTPIFITPPGYHPMGPVTIRMEGTETTVLVNARAW